VSARTGGLLAALAVAALAALALAVTGTGQEALPAATARPVLGVADLETVLMGSSPAASAGEVWGYRRLPLDVGPPVAGGRRLEFGDPGSVSNPDPQLAFLRYADATGWQVYETPVDEAGKPFRGMLDNPLSARMTPRAGGLLVGRDTRAPADDQVTVLLRDPGARFRVLGDPPPGVLEPASGAEPAETLAGDRGTGAVAVAAYEEALGKTGAFFAPIGRQVQDAVIAWNGLTWTREPVCLPPADPPAPAPAGSPCPSAAAPAASFGIVALAATSAANAWMLAQPDPALGRGLVLYQRRVVAGQPRWEERSLGLPLFAARETAAEGVTDLGPLHGSADPLTVTDKGVWLDGSLKQGDREHDFTVYFDPAAQGGRITGSWCDAAAKTRERLCDEGLGVDLSSQTGYRSFAWSGGGRGTRVITNPLEVGGDDQTNRGTYLVFDGARFQRRPGAGGNQRRSAAFSSVGEGWLQGPTHVTTGERPSKLARWPVALRSPLTDVAPRPDQPRGALPSQAVAVGQQGAVARYLPGTGWTREFLLTSSGTVAKPTLRGVAWPEADRAYAVGDLGAMWLWRADTGLWERDPATPIGFEGNLQDVAFDPGNPERGYAVGKSGVLLRYDKTWTQEALPAGFEGANFTQVAFAGSQALAVAGGAVLVNDGSGWRVDDGVSELLAPFAAAGPLLFSVSGLPDGGAVVAGRNIVLERDGHGSAWRFSDQPLLDSTVIAAGAFRDGARVRAVVSVVPRLLYPGIDEIPPPDPNVPPPIIPPFGLPGDGYVLRETAEGWHDEQLTAFSGSGTDRPIKSDPILSFDLDDGGEGWAVGGWSGDADSAGRGNSGRGGQGKADRARVQTGGIYRYSTGGAPAGPGAASAAPIPLQSTPARFAVAGHAACEQPCADLADQELAPDRTLSAVLGNVAELAGRPSGPRFLAYTGGRLPPGQRPAPEREAARYASLLGSRPQLPVYPAASAGDASGGTVDPFRRAFAGFNAPFGQGAPPAGVSLEGIPGGAPGPGARTHYAFDSTGTGGTVRMIVIDNSGGSLAGSDAYQNPAEPQRPWLERVLADAKEKGIAAVVMGSRDLNTRFRPRLNAASDGDEVAKLLVDGGASAYFFERTEEQRTYRIPAGGAQTIPAYGTGTLGYRSPSSNLPNADKPDAIFGDTGFLVAEVDTANRDGATNRAPVAVRLIPVVEDVSLQAVDGTLLRRSRVALFQGLGRRPIAGDRWGRSGGADPQPPGGDPYIAFPPALCLLATCGTRITPEYRFTSSRPFIGDFVKVDPTTTNLRKPLLGSDDKVTTDSSSGLFCAFNPGTTTVTIEAGGLSYSQKVTVLGGSVQRPCGTRVIPAEEFAPATASVQPPPPPAPAPAPISSPPPTVAPPPPPPPPPAGPAPPVNVPPPTVAPNPPPPPSTPSPPPIPPILPAIPAVPVNPNDLNSLPPSSPPPPAPAIARPIPPGGAVARVYQVEEKREEEAAPEMEGASTRYTPDEHAPTAPFVLGFIVIAALAGASINLRSREARRGRRARRPSPTSAWATVERPQHQPPLTTRRPPFR